MDLSLVYDRSQHASSTGFYRGYAYNYSQGAQAIFLADTAQTGAGTIGSSDPWVIATVVPEPEMLALLATALLGLGGVCLRRKQAA